MNDFARIIGATLFISATLLVLAPLNALLGAFAGWSVSLFFGDSILNTLRSVGLPTDVSMWQLGAAMGFVGSFLRTSVTQRGSE